MEQAFLTLLQELVDLPSPSGDETAALLRLEQELVLRGFQVQRIPVSDGRFNLLAQAGGPPTVVFCTHVDVVPPHVPFRRSGDVLYGRGVLDAKGIAVSMLAAAERLRSRGERDFALLYVVGEETTSDGAQAAARVPLNSRFVVVGEPTENHLAAAQKGTLRFVLRTAGKAGHSSQPDAGPSAIHSLIEIVHDLLRTPWPGDPELGETTLNIGRIGGGEAANVIAPEAWAEGMFRVATSMADVEKMLREVVAGRGRIEPEGGTEPQRFLTLPGFPQTVVSFGSDAGYLRPLGEVLMLGPGSIRYAHAENEQVTLEELEQSVELYERLYCALREWALESGGS
ncbi:MAG: acetylornithine deacetylase [Acidobacteriota bacterium]